MRKDEAEKAVFEAIFTSLYGKQKISEKIVEIIKNHEERLKKLEAKDAG